MEQSDGQQPLGIIDVQDDDPFQVKASSLPNENQFLPIPSDEVGSNRSSTGTSDEETDVGFMNKTRSFPDLTKSAHAQQQALAIKEARLKKREEAIQQREFHLQRQQNEAAIRGYPPVYSGEQPLYNWSGAMAYTGQPNSQASPATYIYHHNEQQWSRPHCKCYHYTEQFCQVY